MARKYEGVPPLRTARTTHSLFALCVHITQQRHTEGHSASAGGRGTPRQYNRKQGLDLQSMYINRRDARDIGNPIAKNNGFSPQKKRAPFHPPRPTGGTRCGVGPSQAPAHTTVGASLADPLATTTPMVVSSREYISPLLLVQLLKGCIPSAVICSRDYISPLVCVYIFCSGVHPLR